MGLYPDQAYAFQQQAEAAADAGDTAEAERLMGLSQQAKAVADQQGAYKTDPLYNGVSSRTDVPS